MISKEDSKCSCCPTLPSWQFGDNFSFRDLLFLSEGAIVHVWEDILVDLIGLQSIGEVSLPPAISFSHLGGLPINLWNIFMLTTFMNFQSISRDTLKVAHTFKDGEIDVDMVGVYNNWAILWFFITKILIYDIFVTSFYYLFFVFFSSFSSFLLLLKFCGFNGF